MYPIGLIEIEIENKFLYNTVYNCKYITQDREFKISGATIVPCGNC